MGIHLYFYSADTWSTIWRRTSSCQLIINRLQKEVAEIPQESLPEFLLAERDFQYLKGAFCQRLGINVNMMLIDSPSLEATFDKNSSRLKAKNLPYITTTSFILEKCLR
ncbi:hypothetical protein V1264_016705 [Littorina saxatilis]|uniref:Uncharacterized protein n=1 Tax=Littorina saxatilis TaxID=31220 RepID=A0AAN9GEZ2_9CAEN